MIPKWRSDQWYVCELCLGCLAIWPTTTHELIFFYLRSTNELISSISQIYDTGPKFRRSPIEHLVMKWPTFPAVPVKSACYHLNRLCKTDVLPDECPKKIARCSKFLWYKRKEKIRQTFRRKDKAVSFTLVLGRKSSQTISFFLAFSLWCGMRSIDG